MTSSSESRQDAGASLPGRSIQGSGSPTRATWPAYRVGLLLLAIWALIFSVLAWSSWQAIERYERHANEQVEQRTRLVALMQATLIDSELDAIDRDLRVVRERLIQRLDEPASQHARTMESSLDANALVRDLWWLNESGAPVATRRRAADLPIDPAGEAFFRVHVKAPARRAGDPAFLSQPIDAGDTRLMAMSRALLDANGTFHGVLVAYIDLAAVAALLDRVTASERLVSLLAHRQGGLLLDRADPTLPSETLLDWLRAGDPAQPVGRFPGVSGGHAFQYALARPTGWPLDVVAAEDLSLLSSRLAANANDHHWRLLIWAVVSGLLLLLVGWLFTRRASALEQVAISERRLAASHRRNAAIIEAMPDLLFTMDTEGRILDFEPGDGIPLLAEPETFLGRTVADVLPPDLAELTLSVIQRTLASGEVQTYQYHLDFDGSRHYYEGRCSPLTEASVLILIIDITARKQAENALEWAATHDALTRLPNRRLFLDRLHLAVNEFHRYGGIGFCLLYLDLNGFKAVNDGFGHAAGDQLLQQVAERLREQMRSADSLARLSGDEFVVMVSHASRAEARVVVDKLREEVGRPYELDQGEARVSVSIGVACCPEDGRSAEALMQAADADMYRQKRER
ncbi:diguanylate cyclase [Guyparkeria hydrothermalis]|uniref:sensor domain-containing diguanylate cyclase n=1 Tax=Guyparkeria TaxID=2035712 RepID=UPI0010ACE886|nr:MULTISPECIES: diguanylate cyclase [Guyparkeria]MCL7751876.1 diguanylate cyclase [Guyparkeria hydrothermalis]TKA90022.1 diguanylate cyclase [Guyparkeria sp. SB14A]